MNLSKKKIVLISIFTLAIAILIILISILKTPTTRKIYKQSMSNIVELKAQNDENLISYGTAIMINSSGEFVTNAHVISYITMGIITEFDNYYIRFSFEEEYREVDLIKYDIELDIALLQFKELPKFKLESIKIGSTSKLNSGDTVYAIGNSQNFGISISKGIVGIPLINIEYDGKTRSVIQCDLTITEGNSGGALLNKNGKLIGITTFRTKDNKGNVIYGIAYCIPINIVMQYVRA